MIKKISVKTKNNSYIINVGFNLFQTKKIFNSLHAGDRVLFITDNTIPTEWKYEVLQCLLRQKIIVNIFNLPSGENHKNLNSVNLIISFLLKNFYDRNSKLIAFGGGVIGDITGFVASIYQRGISFLQIPTTLLAQVDASIGGKTGVNHILGKNMVGTFWQPDEVITNINFLSTLPRKELISGLAEVIKYAISFDFVFFEWLENNIDKILRLDPVSLSYCIEQCCLLKVKIVSLDEREENARMLLNFGHTYGHAIEAYFKYSDWLHGEAISVGMILAMKTAEQIGILHNQHTKRMIHLLQKSGLPIIPPASMSSESYIQYMERDKKNNLGNIQLVLPTAIGKLRIIKNIDKNIIISVVQSYNFTKTKS